MLIQGIVASIPFRYLPGTDPKLGVETVNRRGA
jgi:hypothetical protein